MFILEEVKIVHWQFDDIDVQKASKYVAVTHRM